MKNPKNQPNPKLEDLAKNTLKNEKKSMTTDQGLPINDDQNSLKAGDRGPSLLEDFILREKITHFDHERIPERIVHARGSGAHGVFKLHTSLNKYTKAKIFTEVGKETPVFTRFSTVAGSKGSTDLARDVRGFAVKFYTEEGNYDLVGNNMPVFFIQDAMKFPDLVHAVKPEPHNEVPQAASAHDTFWDFISLMPESMHMIMWAMSDRAIPRSLRMMEGFGVHTFRFINEQNESTFVKFHWKPKLGMHSVVWDEAQKISGKDSDFHKKDLWDAIENGDFPEWDLGVQLIPEKDEHKYDFDLLDATKLIPESEVPVQLVGTMTLNRNPSNFFAETEQVAFHPGHLVPGIDFTNDPLLQGRLFSYTDTQLSRLGSPNFHEIPINRSINPVRNNQRDGHMRQQINEGVSSYHPNTIADGCPFQAMMKDGGFHSHEERVDGRKIRTRSKSFMDHFSQAKLFFNSQTKTEQQHIINALQFELSKVSRPHIRENMVNQLTNINMDLAKAVADALGIAVPEKPAEPVNEGKPADADKDHYKPVVKEPKTQTDDALSIIKNLKNATKTRKIAFLTLGKHDGKKFSDLSQKLEKAGAKLMVVSDGLGTLKSDSGGEVEVSATLFNSDAVLFDALVIAGGEKNGTALLSKGKAKEFVMDTFNHCKPILILSDASAFIDELGLPCCKGETKSSSELFIDTSIDAFLKSLSKHRHWEREELI
ncbi:catalase [Cyclobacterium lianum]|uniref:Catalase n=1 Tax=Cyclobacterium lianum TaxID=388280 RepID=A0A1M7L001_9BACT|nr:catalase [Cyclobacterium lianum]SHM70819.1 catalase [Cyclobacterium lianum]